jgi:hypothetical protein
MKRLRIGRFALEPYDDASNATMRLETGDEASERTKARTRKRRPLGENDDAPVRTKTRR